MKYYWFKKLLQVGTRLPGREFFWVVVGQGIGAFGSIIGVRFLTHAMTPNTYGEFALGMTIATLVNQIIFGPIANAILRFFSPALESHQLQTYVKSVYFLLNWATIVIGALVSCATLGLLITHHREWLIMLWVTIGYALLISYCQAMDGMQNAARQRIIVAWHDGVAPWLRPLMAISLIALLGSYSRVVMLGYLLATLLILGSQTFFFNRRILTLTQSDEKVQGERSVWTGKMLSYAWPFASWGVFTWLQLVSDRWALQIFGTTTMVGLYTSLYQIGYYPLILLSGLLAQFISPILYSWAGSGEDTKRMQRVWHATIGMVTVILFISLVATTAAYLTHNFIFSSLVAPAYQIISPLLPGMVLAGGLFAAGQVASLFIMSNSKTRFLISPKIGTAFLGVGLNILGAFLGGVAGVVLASVLFSIVYCAWMLWLARNYAKTIRATGQALFESGEFHF